MNIVANPDELHRLVKQALDSGQAASLEEAEAMFKGFRLGFHIDDSRDRDNQAALLTGVTLARRVFLGGVSVSGDLDVPLAVPLPLWQRLGDAVRALGVTPEGIASGTPLISITRQPQQKGARFHVRTAFAGWRGGIIPAHAEVVLDSRSVMALSPMLAAALAVNEAYLFVRGESGDSGRRNQGLSLWRPGPAASWLREENDGPALQYLPARLWLIGLGHLGQAYLWGLSLLPYRQPGDLEIVLQDVDKITVSSESTSILSDPSIVGEKKTRAMAGWAGKRGFNTRIYERLFDGSFRRQDDEPSIALCGLDNALGRQALDQVGFDFVVEAGLGRDYRNFQTMRIHTLPGKRSAAEIWNSGQDQEATEDRAAYQAMLESGQLDQCGITLLAGKAVGAPFVGSVAACLVLAEVLRLLHGDRVHELIDLDLRSVEHRLAVAQRRDFTALNPGYAKPAGAIEG